jgi:hypothetical protein
MKLGRYTKIRVLITLLVVNSMLRYGYLWRFYTVRSGRRVGDESVIAANLSSFRRQRSFPYCVIMAIRILLQLNCLSSSCHCSFGAIFGELACSRQRQLRVPYPAIQG